MSDYTKLVEALRCENTGDDECGSSDCPYWSGLGCMDGQLMEDAADAIEALQAELERLKDSNEELREKQTFIDHYGTEWMTSAKDVPTAAYKHGYADGRGEAKAQLPKKGEWKPFDLTYGRNIYSCSVCEQATEVPMCMAKPMYAYCPNCGARMGKPEPPKEDA